MWLLRWVKVGTAAGLAWSTTSIRRVRIDGHRLNEYTGDSTWGRTVIEVVGNDLDGLADCCPRGSFMELLLGFPGYAAADYQRVAWGQLRQVRGTAPTWVIELVDAPTGLRQRPTHEVSDIELFHDLDPEEYTVLDADYATSDTTLTVDSTTGFLRETYGAVVVTPSSGDPFYLLWSAATSTEFTVLAADNLGTVRTVAVTGDAVGRAAYLAGHPIDIALKVLTSGLGGANGPYDVLPVSWGLQVPCGMVDITDASFFRDSVAIVGSGSYQWRVAQTAPEPDALGWVQELLKPAGFYLTMRQGSITVRAIQSTTVPVANYATWEITDAHVIEVQSHDWWSSDHGEECASIVAKTDSVSASITSAAVYQRPTAVAAIVDLTAVLFDNVTEVLDEVTTRLLESRTSTPEAVTLQLGGWWWAQAAPGDRAFLTCSRLTSRVSPAGVVSRPAKVVQVSPSWDGAPTTTVTLLLYPYRGERWA